MKKFLLVVAIILTFSSTAFATFSDMPSNEFYSTAINDLAKDKIINGYEDNTFRPSANITRAEFAKMMATALNLEEVSTQDFNDVSANHWAAKFINSVYTKGLVEGYEDGSFKPEKNITYGEIATILVRAMEKEQTALDTNLTWPDNYFTTAQNLGLFEGWATNDLLAGNNATRENTALMIWNMLNPKDTDDTQTTTDKVNTKLSYAGLVTRLKTRAGIKYVTVDNGEERTEYALPKKSDVPEIGSFIIFQLNSNGEMKLKDETYVSDKSNNVLTVTDIDDKIFVKFAETDKILDLELDKYTVDGKELKISKYNYFILEIEDGEFTSFELTTGTDNLKLKKNDLVKFDKEYNLCYIFRENV